MFHKEDVEAYKSISAPKELKEKVLMAKKREKTYVYRQLHLVAACLAVTISLSLMWNWSHSVISIQGDEQMVSMAFEAREIAKTSISVNISSNHTRKITVSEGSLLLGNAEGKDTVWVKPGEELLWKLDSQPNKEYKLFAKGWGKDKVYLLSYNQVNENWELKEQ